MKPIIDEVFVLPFVNHSCLSVGVLGVAIMRLGVDWRRFFLIFFPWYAWYRKKKACVLFYHYFYCQVSYTVPTLNSGYSAHQWDNGFICHMTSQNFFFQHDDAPKQSELHEDISCHGWSGKLPPHWAPTLHQDVLMDISAWPFVLLWANPHSPTESRLL